ncbi:armadillo-type protein [Blyttiomyces helicus]|uniref:Armadillo-type protein n=1 Tax=Blyttiomyces helicus TaxID=388810 RepID=A0A4P9WHA0_9FUNG|nr:armadillo-type protein [Blyttiomyces helicus]|eukprot:RKO91223.1 armadillo-type protein [Blyttiomyces helicus]
MGDRIPPEPAPLVAPRSQLLLPAVPSKDIQSKANEILQLLQRDINILGEPTSDRLAKRRALERIGASPVLAAPADSMDPAVVGVVARAIVWPLVRCFADPVEKCRELSVGVVVGLGKRSDDPTPLLEHILPAIESRLAQPEIVEPAEEVRLALVEAITALAERVGQVWEAHGRANSGADGFALFIESCARILIKTFEDPFPDVKKASCKLLMVLAKANPIQMKYQGEALAKAIVPCLQHRHSGVRTIGLQALTAAILTEATALPSLHATLRTLSLDKTQSVRETLYATAATWLLTLIDRYSFGHAILPLLLGGLTDELEPLRAKCRAWIDEVGRLYEKEWEDRVKDELDYIQGNLLAEGKSRPRVGCRHLARDNTQKIVTKTVEGMADWNVEVRIKSTQILATFIPYTEDQITGYTNVILPALFRILAGDEPEVVREATKAAQLVGTYIDPSVTLQLLIPSLRTGSNGASQFRIGCLRALAAVVRGTVPAARLAESVPLLVAVLAEPELVRNENVLVLVEVAAVAAELVGKMGAENAQACLELYVVLVELLSVAGDERVPGFVELRQKVGGFCRSSDTGGLFYFGGKTQADRCLVSPMQTSSAVTALSTLYGLDSVQALHALHLDAVLARLAATQPSWTEHSHERRLLDTVLVEAGPAVGGRLDAVVPIFVGMAALEMDLEVRSGLFTLILTLLRTPSQTLNSTHALPSHTLALLTGILIPNATWKPGRKAARVRGLAIDTLLALLAPEPPLLDRQACIAEIPRLVPVLIGTLEEDEIATRDASLRVFERMLRWLEFDAATLKSIYPPLLKRLDDAHDPVRIAASRTLTAFFFAVERWSLAVAPLRPAGDPNICSVVDVNGSLVELRIDDVHWTAIVKGMTIHLDDPDRGVQDAVCESLQACATVAPPTVMREQLSDTVKARHRTPRFIDAVLARVPQ